MFYPYSSILSCIPLSSLAALRWAALFLEAFLYVTPFRSLSIWENGFF